SGEDVEPPPALERHEPAHLQPVDDRDVRRYLAQQREREAVPYVLPGQRRLPGDVLALWQIREVGERIHVVAHARQRVAAVEADAVGEALLGLERGAVIVRRA